MADDLTPKRPVLYDGNGRPIHLDRDGPLPHVYTFAGILAGSWETYFKDRHDEAMRHNRDNALAMRLDEHIQSCLWERVRSTTKLKWRLEVDSPNDPWQKLVVDGLTKAIKQTPRLRQLKRWLLWEALWAGRSAVQMKLEWDQVDVEGLGPHRALTVAAHHPVNGDKLAFRWDDTPAVLVHGAADLPNAETVLTSLGPAVALTGQWRERFLIHKVNCADVDYFEGDRAEAIHGLGIRHWLYWSWWNKQEYISAVLKSLDRVGLGLVVVEYDESSATGQAEAAKLARNMSVDRSVVTVPVPRDRMGASGAVRVVNTPIAGAQVMLELQAACERREERFIIAQTGSSRSDTSGMGTHDPQFMMETKSDLVEEDAGELDETLTGGKRESGLVYLLKKYTYPWADFPVRHVADVSPPDPERRLGSATMAFNLGADLIADEVREVAGFSKPGPDDHTLVNPQIAQAMQQLQMQQQGGGVGPDGQPPPGADGQAVAAGGAPPQQPPGGGAPEGQPDPAFEQLYQQGAGGATVPAGAEGSSPYAREDEPILYTAGEAVPSGASPPETGMGGGALHPPAVKAPPFHSRLQNALGGLGSKPLPAQAVYNRIKKAGVPDEEWHAAQMPAALEGKAQVAPAELLQHFHANKVLPGEVWRGTDPPGGERGRLLKRLEVLHFTPGEPHEVAVEMGRIREKLDALPSLPEPRYHEYQTPGGENYRELLLTVPEKRHSDLVELERKYGKANYAQDLMDRGATRAEAHRWAELQRMTPDNYRSPHWDEPNVIAHARMNDRLVPPAPEVIADIGERIRGVVGAKSAEGLGSGAPEAAVRKGAITEPEAALWSHARGMNNRFAEMPGAAGEKALHVEEIQSDLHQAGREKGYKPDAEQVSKASHEFNDAVNELKAKYGIKSGRELQTAISLSQERWRRMGGDGALLSKDETERITNAERRYNQMLKAQSSGVPDLPYKDSWPTLALKRLLYHAAEHGHDRLTLNSGKQIQSLVGGEEGGQSKFYDETLPNVLAKLGKPYGVKPERANLPSAHDPAELRRARHDLADAENHVRKLHAYYADAFPGVPLDQLPVGDRNYYESQQRVLDHHRQRLEEMQGGPAVTSLRLTPEMRRSILATGFPHMEEGGVAPGGPTVLQPGETVHPGGGQPWQVPMLPGADPDRDSVVAPLHAGDVVQPVRHDPADRLSRLGEVVLYAASAPAFPRPVYPDVARKGPMDPLNPGGFAPEGEGIIHPGLAKPKLGTMPQPLGLATHRKAGQGLGSLLPAPARGTASTAGQPTFDDLLAVGREYHALTGGFPWHQAGTGDHARLFDHLRRMPPGRFWDLVHRLQQHLQAGGSPQAGAAPAGALGYARDDLPLAYAALEGPGGKAAAAPASAPAAAPAVKAAAVHPVATPAPHLQAAARAVGAAMPHRPPAAAVARSPENQHLAHVMEGGAVHPVFANLPPVEGVPGGFYAPHGMDPQGVLQMLGHEGTVRPHALWAAQAAATPPTQLAPPGLPPPPEPAEGGAQEPQRGLLVDPHTMGQYDAEFARRIRDVATRTRNPALREHLLQWAQNHGLSRLIVKRMKEAGVHEKMPMDVALQQAAVGMLMPVNMQGKPRRTLFEDFAEPPGYGQPGHEGAENPLRARASLWARRAARNLSRAGGRRHALDREPLPGGQTVPVGPAGEEGNIRDPADPRGALEHHQADFESLVGEFAGFLRQKEKGQQSEGGGQHLQRAPLADVFHSMLQGENDTERDRRFGQTAARRAKHEVREAVKEYAAQSGNEGLRDLAGRLSSSWTQQKINDTREMKARKAAGREPAAPQTPEEALAFAARQAGPALKAAREGLGLSTSDLARLAGIHSQSIYKLERGGQPPRAATVAKLAAALREAQRRGGG